MATRSSSRPRTFDLDQKLPGGFRMPARMTAVPFGDGGVALVSPVPIDDATAREIATLGEVRYLVAPNLLHHLYLGPAAARYPGARVLAPPGLAAKRPDLRIDASLADGLPDDLGRDVAAVRVDGAPGLDEFVLHHAASRTVIVTDLLFNVVRPQGVVAHVALFLVGCHGRLAQSRALRFMIKDRAAAAASAARIAALPCETLIVAHGDVVTDNAGARLRRALGGMLGAAGASSARSALPAARPHLPKASEPAP